MNQVAGQRGGRKSRSGTVSISRQARCSCCEHLSKVMMCSASVLAVGGLKGAVPALGLAVGALEVGRPQAQAGVDTGKEDHSL